MAIKYLQALPLFFTLRIRDDLFALYFTIAHSLYLIFSIEKNVMLLVSGLVVLVQSPLTSAAETAVEMVKKSKADVKN
jgi:hypothetical protein